MDQILRLPDWEMVGGESQAKSFTLTQDNGVEYSLPGATAQLAVVPFVNTTSTPLLTKLVQVTASESGNYCEVEFSLSPADTISFAGKYIYQVTIKDAQGNTSAPQGYLYVRANIDKAFSTSV